MRWHRLAYHLGPHDRTTLLSSPGFDVSVWDTGPATSGGDLIGDQVHAGIPAQAGKRTKIIGLGDYPQAAHLRLEDNRGDAFRRKLIEGVLYVLGPAALRGDMMHARGERPAEVDARRYTAQRTGADSQPMMTAVEGRDKIASGSPPMARARRLSMMAVSVICDPVFPSVIRENVGIRKFIELLPDCFFYCLGAVANAEIPA